MSQLAHARQGHFDLGTGYHGDVWLDLDALFLRPALLRLDVRWLADRLRQHRVDAVCGPMEGGAFLAYALADALEVAFLPAYRAAAPDEGTGAATAYRLAWAGGAGKESAGGGWPSPMTRSTRGRPSGPAPGSCAITGRSPSPSRPCCRSARPVETMSAALSVPFYCGRDDAEPGVAGRGLPAVRRAALR